MKLNNLFRNGKCGLGTLVILIFVNFGFLFNQSCALQKQSSTYQTLSVSKSAYDSVLTIAGDLYKQGIISDIQKNEIIRVSKEYKKYHNLSVEAYLLYKQTNGPKAQNDYLSNTVLASQILAELIKYIQPYMEGK